jgi:hypothetical protein
MTRAAMDADARLRAGRGAWGMAVARTVILYLAFRLPWLRSIPGYTFDEGLLGLVAKNWVAFGDPLYGGNLDLLCFPLFSSLLAGAYALFGHSLLVSRLLSVAAGLAALFLLAAIARRLLPRSAVVWALLLYATDFVLVRYQRYGLAESVQILLILAVVLVWIRPSVRRSLYGGLMLGAAVLLKPTSIHILPALIWFDAGLMRHGWERFGQAEEAAADRDRAGGPGRPTLRQTITPHALALALCVSVYGAMWLAWRGSFLDAWRLYAHAPAFGDLPRTIAILCVGSPLAALGVARLPVALRRSPDWGLRFLAVWIGGGFLLLLAQMAHPVRFYAALWPAAILCGADLLRAVAQAIGRRVEVSDGIVPEKMLRAAVGIAVVIIGALLFVGYYHVLGHRNSTGADVAAWTRANVPPQSVVIGAPHLGVDVPNPFLDMTSIHALAVSDSLLRSRGINYVIYDPEWRRISEKLKLGVEDSLRACCRLRSRIGDAEIWEAQPRRGS